MRCHRCQDSPDYDRDQLHEHATQTGHPLCAVCRRSLHPTEPQTCRQCLDRARTNLDDITDAWTRLNHDRASWPTGTRHTTPGGDRLVLAGPGSNGATQQTGVWTGGQWHREHVLDERAADPHAIAYSLAEWAADWASTRGAPPPDTWPTMRPVALFDSATSYLTRHLQWAANTHPAFADFAGDIHRLRGRLNATLGLTDRPAAGAPCLRCSTPPDPVYLERLWTDAGLADVWCCPRCGDTLTPAQYLLAVRAALEAS